MNQFSAATKILTERFGCDSLISVATVDGTRPHVRTVNGYYEDGAFYVVTYALSNKMKQIENHADVAVCGEWFTGHGVGKNMGHVRNGENIAMMSKLRKAFAAWYDNGHTDEDDPNTCLLCIRLTDGVLFNDGTKYVLDFVHQKA